MPRIDCLLLWHTQMFPLFLSLNFVSYLLWSKCCCLHCLLPHKLIVSYSPHILFSSHNELFVFPDSIMISVLSLCCAVLFPWSTPPCSAFLQLTDAPSPLQSHLTYSFFQQIFLYPSPSQDLHAPPMLFYAYNLNWPLATHLAMFYSLLYP